MDVYHGLDSLPPIATSVLTIGNFDGVHLAHRELVCTARRWAEERGAPAVALTFEPHPLAVVAPERAPATLTPLRDKLTLLREAGADSVVVARSDASLLGLEPERFVHDVVLKRFHPSDIVEGPSFGFGRRRAGDVRLLAKLCAEAGARVHVLEPMRVRLSDDRDALISSSLARELIAGGRVEDAALVLGRSYELTGRVVRGDQRGRTLGFPTANLDGMDRLIPGDGVYAGRARIEPSDGTVESDAAQGAAAKAWGDAFACAISIGSAATFHGATRRVEAHLLDFDSDLYGQSLRVRFDRILREQRRFPSAEALVAQLRIDVEQARRSVAGDQPRDGVKPCLR